MERKFGGRDPGYQERFPDWKRSDGKLRQEQRLTRQADEKEQKADKMKGYIPSQKERERGEPVKIETLESSYGSFSIGVDWEGGVRMVTSQKRKSSVDSLEGEERDLDGQTAVSVPKTGGIEGDFSVNLKDKQESAVGYRDEAATSRPVLMRRLKKMNKIGAPEVYAQILPFLEKAQEETQLSELKKLENEAGFSPSDKALLEKRMEFLSGMKRDKEQELHRFTQKMDLLLDEAKRGLTSREAFIRIPQGEPLLEEDPDEEEPDGADPDEEETGETGKDGD